MARKKEQPKNAPGLFSTKVRKAAKVGGRVGGKGIRIGGKMVLHVGKSLLRGG